MIPNFLEPRPVPYVESSWRVPMYIVPRPKRCLANVAEAGFRLFLLAGQNVTRPEALGV